MLIAGTTRRWPYYVFVTPASTVTSDLYFDLSLLTVFWTKVRSDGGDVRVFAQDGVTPVAREVSGFDYANKRGSLFVATSGATAFYITCGSGVAEPAVGSAYGKYNVWESAAKLVAHLEDITDSTINQNSMTDQGAVGGQTGKVQKAYTFSGTSQYIDTGSNVGNFGLSNSFAVFAWINFTTDGSDRVIFGNTWATRGWEIRKTSTNKIRFIAVDTGVIYSGMDSSALSSGWHRVVGVWNGSSAKVYVDGSPASITPLTDGVMTNITTTAHTMIGLDTVADGHYFNGTIDEVVVLARLPSDAEIATDYANQNNPTSFWTTGPEV